jgi:outer membrane immunogenic protein
MNSVFVNSLRLSAMTAITFAALSAQAADMYAPKVSMKDMPVPEFSWSGFYLGVNSGYGWGASHSTVYTDATDAAHLTSAGLATTVSNTSSLWTQGGFGGGQLGYNVQRDRFVFGVETDIQASAIKGAAVAEAAVFPATFLLPSVMSEALTKSNLDWFGTVRARLGYSLGNTLFFGNTLVYATGGFAYGGVKDTLIAELTSTNVTSTTAPLATSGATAAVDSRNANLTGWVVGGGVEVALSPSWSAKAEYQYIDLGSTNLSAPTSLSYTLPDTLAARADLGSASVKIDHTYNTVRLGLNYRINQAPEPLPLK